MRHRLIVFIMWLTASQTLAQETETAPETIAGLPLATVAILVMGGMALLIAALVGGTFANFRRPALSASVTALLAFTGVEHLVIGTMGDGLLLLNGIGYLVLLGLQFLPQISFSSRYRILDAAVIAYTVITIIGYILLHDSADLIGIIVKASEITLILALLLRSFVYADDTLRTSAITTE